MKLTQEQLEAMVASNSLRYSDEEELEKVIPFGSDCQSCLDAAITYAELAQVHIDSFDEGHVARDMAMRKVVEAVTLMEGLDAQLKEVAIRVLAIKTGKLYFS